MSGSARSQVAINLGFTLLKSVFVLLSIRMADALLTAQMMGLVLLFRRQGALWGNLAQLGLSQSLLKFYTANDDAEARKALWGRLVRWVAVAGCVTVALSVLFADQLNAALFAAEDSGLAIAFGIYVAGLALGFMANSSWMAEFRFVHSNTIDWLNGSLLFVICLGFGSGLAATPFAFWLALLTLGASAAFLVWFSQHQNCGASLVERGWRLSGEVTQYGLTRALTAFADMATLVLGPWLLRDQPDQAGYLIVAYTALRLAQALVLPVAQVLALRANSHQYDSQREERRILWLCAVVFLMAWCAVGGYYVVGDWFMHWWLPDSSAEVMGLLDELIVFLPAVCLFYSLRNYVDLSFSAPWNLCALILSMVVFYLSTLVSHEVTLQSAVDSSKAMFSVFYLYGLVVVSKLYRSGSRVQ